MKKIYTLILILCTSQFVFAQTWTKLDCGTEFSLAIRSDGTLWAWGYNANGQLGIGTNTMEIAPVQVGTDNDWMDVAAGAVHSLAVKNNGTLWAWGGNGVNQLGNSTTTDSNIPLQIGTDTDWQKVEGGQAHSFAIKTNQSLWAWGYNAGGQVGDGTMIDVGVPTQIGSAMDWQEVSAGGFHSMGLKTDSTLWVWGNNANGELGLGNTTSHTSPIQCGVETDWTAISAGFQFCMGLRQGGNLWTWGFNGNDQLGDDGLGTTQTTPANIEPNIIWKKIAAASSYAYGIKNDGSLYAWGSNQSGQLGQGNINGLSSPTQVGVDTDWENIHGADGLFANNAVYGSFSLAIKTPRNVICAAGTNLNGQLGNGTTQDNLVFDCNTGGQAVSVVDQIFEKNVLLYPNPSRGLIHLEIKDGWENARLELYSLTGKLLFQEEISSAQSTYDCSHLSSGVYYVRISHGVKQVTQKLILE